DAHDGTEAERTAARARISDHSAQANAGAAGGHARRRRRDERRREALVVWRELLVGGAQREHKDRVHAHRSDRRGHTERVHAAAAVLLLLTRTTDSPILLPGASGGHLPIRRNHDMRLSRGA